MSVIILILSIIPIAMTLSRILRISSAEARESRKYYSFCLISLLAWSILNVVMVIIPAALAIVTHALNRLIFIVATLSVYLFVTSTIYFTRTPRTLERLFISSPIVAVIIANLTDPFEVTFTPYGWDGNISNPIMRYSWLALVTFVILYSFTRLSLILVRVRTHETKRRLTFFLASHMTALVTGLVFSLLIQIAEIPKLSNILVNFSLLPTYLAFSPAKRE